MLSLMNEGAHTTAAGHDPAECPTDCTCVDCIVCGGCGTEPGEDFDCLTCEGRGFLPREEVERAEARAQRWAESRRWDYEDWDEEEQRARYRRGAA